MADVETLEDFGKALAGEAGRDYLPLGPYLNKSYLDYSVSVILDRALPDVRDGLKPVHRRILYAMHQLGLTARAAHKKSARVVGDVIGKYHPHGDASVYEAMVLMAQRFKLRHPLVDGQGNWGSGDGDRAAAMRYTEARMTDLTRLLLDEINQGTVDWKPNYDGNDLEPVCLPARVPAVLLNEQMGIAVGMGCDLLPHNLAEVCRAAIALFKNPEGTTLAGLLRSIKGPDFAGGGQVINPRADLEELYATGKGQLTVRGRYEVVKDRDGWHLVFTELPPGVSPEEVLLEFEALSNPQPKVKGKAAGKKGEKAAITAEQRAAKQLMLDRVSEVGNGAGNDTGPVHLEVYPRSRRQKPEELAAYLFGVTSLESRVRVNMNMIDLSGRPRQMPLLEILRDWNAFRFDTVSRRCRHRLEKVEARIHILEGFVKILLDIDEVIRLIRASENDQEAKAALMARWQLSDAQAERILEIKLRQLTRLDELAIQKELGDLEAERAELQRLLANPEAMIERIIEELQDDLKRYGTERRTLIEEAEAAAFEDAVLDEPVTIILSKKGWARSRTGHGLDLTGLTFKDGDGLHSVVETRTAKNLVLLDENGRAYTVAAGAIPGGRGDGVPITSLVDLQDRARIVSVFEVVDKARVLLASTIGYGFVTEVENLVGRNKAGKAVLNTAEGVALPAVPLAPGLERVAALSTTGYMLVFGLDEVQEYPKGKGNKLIALKTGEELGRLELFADAVRLPAKRGKSEVVIAGVAVEGYLRKRGSRGRQIPRNAQAPAPRKAGPAHKVAVQDELF
ncbi:MAG: DNA topoisomerase IV subunit A [Deferrisomatales bacterium]